MPGIQYIPRNMHTVFALLCFVVVIHWLIFPYPSGLLHWHCGNLTIAPVPAKQPWWILINTSFEFIMNDCITTTKQSTTKPCAYFLGYTVYHSCQYRFCHPRAFYIDLWHIPCYGDLVLTHHEVNRSTNTSPATRWCIISLAISQVWFVRLLVWQVIRQTNNTRERYEPLAIFDSLVFSHKYSHKTRASATPLVPHMPAGKYIILLFSSYSRFGIV